MARNARGSNRGFTLLELALSVALSAVLIAAFFSASRAMLQGMLISADGVRGPSAAAAAMERITADFEQATAFLQRGPYSLSFTTPAGTIAYRLVALDAASRDVVLERSVNGATSSIGPRRMIANFNPYGATFLINGAPATTQELFAYGGAGPTLAPTMNIYLVLQPNQTAPIQYLRTKAACVTLTSW